VRHVLMYIGVKVASVSITKRKIKFMKRNCFFEIYLLVFVQLIYLFIAYMSVLGTGDWRSNFMRSKQEVESIFNLEFDKILDFS
jgi:TRAP-type uncharacterized transport system fused permease subunit